MKADALIFMAYDYGVAIGRSASETLKLPVDEMLGFYAYLAVKKEGAENG